MSSKKITPDNSESFVGTTFNLLGYRYLILNITPQQDWFWQVEARTEDPDGETRYVELILPSHVLTN